MFITRGLAKCIVYEVDVDIFIYTIMNLLITMKEVHIINMIEILHLIINLKSIVIIVVGSLLVRLRHRK